MCIFKATAFPCFVPGQLGFRGQTQILQPTPLSPQRVIQTSSTQGPPEGRGYTTTPTNMSSAHQTQTFTQTYTQPSPPTSSSIPAAIIKGSEQRQHYLSLSPMGAAEHIAQLSFSKHRHTLSHSLSSLFTHTRSHSPRHACAHVHTHTHTHMHALVWSEDQRLIVSFHQLHHPLLSLSTSCLVVVFMCVCAYTCTSRRLSAVVGAFLSSIVDALEALFCLHTVNKQSCPPLPLFSSISLHLLDFSYGTQFLCLH